MNYVIDREDIDVKRHLKNTLCPCGRRITWGQHIIYKVGAKVIFAYCGYEKSGVVANFNNNLKE